MTWKSRTLIVLVATGLLVGGVPRLGVIPAFLLFAFCVITVAITLAPVLSNFFGSAFIDFIYSTHGTTAETDINDPVIYNQSQNVFSLLRTTGLLTLAAALYGIFWAAPILLHWPSMQDLAEIPPHLVAACVVGGLSVIAWIFYFAFYFVPTLWNRLYTHWINWRYPAQPAPYDRQDPQPGDLPHH